jgi:hypothetical protein
MESFARELESIFTTDGNYKIKIVIAEIKNILELNTAKNED